MALFDALLKIFEVSMMWDGPQAQGRAERLLVVDRIVADLHRVYGDTIRAIGLYGSLARGTDGDFSDIELWCVLTTPGVDGCEEWVYGPSKAEVDLYGEDVMLARAVEVDDMWPLKQGELMNCRPLFGDMAFFAELRTLVMSPPKSAFDVVIAEMVVGEIYEWIGKLRNGVARGELDFLPMLSCEFAHHVALMVALAHRHVYGSGGAMMRETLALPSLPVGYSRLAELVMAGELHDKAKLVAVLEEVWAGIGPWLAQHEIALDARMGWPWS